MKVIRIFLLQNNFTSLYIVCNNLYPLRSWDDSPALRQRAVSIIRFLCHTNFSKIENENKRSPTSYIFGNVIMRGVLYNVIVSFYSETSFRQPNRSLQKWQLFDNKPYNLGILLKQHILTILLKSERLYSVLIMSPPGYAIFIFLIIESKNYFPFVESENVQYFLHHATQVKPG